MYIHAVVNRHRASDRIDYPRRLDSLLRAWAGNNLESIIVSGSRAKGTALHGSDIDLFLSLAPGTPGPLSAMQTSLAAHFRYYFPEIRNVSVRIRFEGAAVDLVPGRRRPDSTAHSLWQSRHNTWLQTDVAKQIRHIRSSSLLNEILALKIWRTRRNLRFPSFVLELAVIRALEPNHPISESFLKLLTFLAKDFPQIRLQDPANSNNIISDLLKPEEKHVISTHAKACLQAPWPDIL